MSEVRKPPNSERTKPLVADVLEQMQEPGQIERRIDSMTDAEHHFVSSVIGAFGDILATPDPEQRKHYLQIAAVMLYFAGKEGRLASAPQPREDAPDA